jgi:hypothetical protein
VDLSGSRREGHGIADTVDANGLDRKIAIVGLGLDIR